MLIRSKKRDIPQVNSSASADIAFLLLVFFLITSSMGTEKGIFKRVLPPEASLPAKQKKEILRRDLMVIFIDSGNRIYLNDHPEEVGRLKSAAKEFINNPQNNDTLPGKEVKEILFFGKILVTAEHVISLKTDRNASYSTYISVQNELIAAYNDLRNEISIRRFRKPYAALQANEQEAVREIYPQRITESPVSAATGKKPDYNGSERGGRR